MAIDLLINDLRCHNHEIGPEIRSAIDRVLARGWYILGPEVEAFEQEFAAYCGVDHCVGVGNGTDALELALRAIDIGSDSKVATVANAGGYATAAILACGATPVYVDVDLATMNLATQSLPPVDALILTHLYGRVASSPPTPVPIIEDCAQAHGAAVGKIGAIACWSFYPTKNLGALGDGGALTTNDGSAANKLRSLRQYGWTSKYRCEVAGGRNSRLDELQAAVLRAKLPHLDRWVERRRQIAARYNEAFSLPQDRTHAAHLFVMRHARRDWVRERLKLAGIATEIHYPIPDYRQAAFVGEHPALPNTERCCREVLTLPCYPEMTGSEIDRVIRTVLETTHSASESNDR